jgi:hypothetical protein
MEKQKSGAQRESLKLIGEEPTSVMPNDMEKLVRELPRDTEIVALFKRMYDCKVWPCNCSTGMTAIMRPISILLAMTGSL